MINQGPSTRQRRRHRTARTVRTIRTIRAVRRIHTTSRRHRDRRLREQGVAVRLRHALQAMSGPSHTGNHVIIKVSLVAIGIVVSLYLMALGSLYLIYRPSTSIPSDPGPAADDGSEREYHVINGRVIIMKKARRVVDSE